MLYSSVTTEENAVKFGDVYSAYAAGMNVERLESYNKEPDKVADEKRVLYAIGAVTTNELLSATRGETFHAPKGVDCVSSSLIDKLQREGVASIDADRQHRRYPSIVVRSRISTPKCRSLCTLVITKTSKD